MHIPILYLQDVGLEITLSIMVLELTSAQNGYKMTQKLSVYVSIYLSIYLCMYQLQNRKGCKVSSLMSHSLPAWCYCVDSSYFNTNNTFWRFLYVEYRVI